MKVSKFVKAYQAAGKTNLTQFANKAGVYLIKSPRTGKVVYIGYSATNLYKTITRHFQSWKDRSQVRVTYAQTSGYTVRVVLTTPKKAAALERALIVRMKPSDNPNKLQLYTETSEDLKALREYKAESNDPFTPNENAIPF